MKDRILPLEGVRNFRDFGGYASRHGGHVKQGRLFRSGHYAEATHGDLQQIRQKRIAVQADLRRPDERERQPGKWSAPLTITHDGGREHEAPHHQFLTKVEADAEKAEAWMTDYYRVAPFKAHHKELFATWFGHLAELKDDEAGLVNCAAGKDRTGILCALTHHVLGVEQEDIHADYILTNHAVDVDGRLGEIATMFNAHIGKSYEPEVFRPFIGVRLPYLETAMATIIGEVGSLDTYLTKTLGVTPAQQDTIRDKLLEG
ncbi:tyrosine-protein phosphatase [uncultured Hyphomonas sp.]|uniref:tyrosine-protein phosphatase n=1 Tax=uncultured Hyphomonas sp. TaxID=225298 RepID=UPI002AAB753D|nr:tyrosine-protein phosphatase [uncultured Hyphomonas sp.]